MVPRIATFITVLLSASVAGAVPGPATTAVVANANVPQSVAMAEVYAARRSVPPSQVCALDLPDAVDMTLADFESRWMSPLQRCLGDRGERVEAIVLMRGVPLRVGIPTAGGVKRVSAAAALGTWQTTMGDGRSIRGVSPGRDGLCGSSRCLTPQFENPYRDGAFAPGWRRVDGGVRWQPVLVTMLHGRSYQDAEGLLHSALAAEAAGGAEGTFLLMRAADAPRSTLDGELEAVSAALVALGVDAEVVPFDANLTGRTLGAFVTGSAGLGDVIEGNTFAAGALVDNVTSYGAVPVNFTPEGQTQVSIARWVARGVAGVHGTTDEPLSHVFPSRRFLVDYASGMSLAESYHRNLPFAYWRNLVLGDPMAAPYAARPEVRLDGLEDDEVLTAGARIAVFTESDESAPVARLTVYLDGVEVAAANDSTLALCLTAPDRRVQVLVVAETAGAVPTKGWTSRHITGAGEAVDCPPPDAGAPMDARPADLGGDVETDAAAADALAPDVEPLDPDSAPALARMDAPPSGGCLAVDSAPGLPALVLLLFWCRRRR